MNCELHWSPCRDDRFLLLLGNELRLYSADAALQTPFGEKPKPPELLVVPFGDEKVKTVAWQPLANSGESTASELLAVSLSTGKIQLRCTMGDDPQGLHNRYLLTSRQQSSVAFANSANSGKLINYGAISGGSLSISAQLQQQQQQQNLLLQQQQQQQQLLPQQQQQQQQQHTGRSPPFLRWNQRRRNMLAYGGGFRDSKLSRTEPVLLLWDIHSAQLGSPKTVLEASGNESVASFAWISEKNFVCGTATKHLRVYDLEQCSSNQPISAFEQESSRVSEIYGVCQDPFQSNRLATYADKHVALWDLRRFDKPTYRYEEARSVRGVHWCCTRNGWLAVSLADSAYLTLHDVTHQDSLGQRGVDYADDLASATDRQIRHGLSGGGAASFASLSGFAWHPKRQLAVMATSDGRLEVASVHERVSACQAGLSGLAYWDGESAVRLLNTTTALSAPTTAASALNPTMSTCIDRISERMWRRAVAGYDIHGPPTFKPTTTTSSSSTSGCLEDENVENVELNRAFAFINELAMPSASGVVGNSVELLRSAGALAIARSRLPEASTVVSEPSGLPRPLAVWRRRPGRHRLLELCRWSMLPSVDASPAQLPSTNRRHFERAACLRLFTVKSVSEVLALLQAGERCSTQQQQQQQLIGLKLVSAALLGALSDASGDFADVGAVGQDSKLPTSIVPDLSDQLEDYPHLRVMFQFVAGGPTEANMRRIVGWDSPDNKKQMDLEDRITFAAIYFSDKLLMEFLTWLNGKLTRQGRLEALLLTGVNFNDDTMALLQAFLDRSGDLQSALILCVAIGHHCGLTLSGSAQHWLTVYRELLNTWQLFEQRALFDLMVRRLLPRQEQPSHQTSVQVQCKFCGKRINHLLTPKIGGNVGGGGSAVPQRMRPSGGGGGGGGGGGSGEAAAGGAVAMLKSKNTACMSCKKALPRCEICLMHLGAEVPDSAAAGSPVASWFVWCQSCRHGGHAQHLREWFCSNAVCPVTGCKCNCA